MGLGAIRLGTLITPQKLGKPEFLGEHFCYLQGTEPGTGNPRDLFKCVSPPPPGSAFLSFAINKLCDPEHVTPLGLSFLIYQMERLEEMALQVPCDSVSPSVPDSLLSPALWRVPESCVWQETSSPLD